MVLDEKTKIKLEIVELLYYNPEKSYISLFLQDNLKRHVTYN